MSLYETLIGRFCELNGLDHPDEIALGAPLDIGGVTCSITASQHDQTNAAVVYVDFGAVPSGRERPVYEELLVQTFVGAPQAGVMFGFSPVSKNVICVQHLRVDEIDAQKLSNILHHLAEKAVEWRRTYFLENEPAAVAQRPIAGSARAALDARLRRP